MFVLITGGSMSGVGASTLDSVPDGWGDNKSASDDIERMSVDEAL